MRSNLLVLVSINWLVSGCVEDLDDVEVFGQASESSPTGLGDGFGDTTPGPNDPLPPAPCGSFPSHKKVSPEEAARCYRYYTNNCHTATVSGLLDGLHALVCGGTPMPAYNSGFTSYAQHHTANIEFKDGRLIAYNWGRSKTSNLLGASYFSGGQINWAGLSGKAEFETLAKWACGDQWAEGSAYVYTDAWFDFVETGWWFGVELPSTSIVLDHIYYWEDEENQDCERCYQLCDSRAGLWGARMKDGMWTRPYVGAWAELTFDSSCRTECRKDFGSLWCPKTTYCTADGKKGGKLPDGTWGVVPCNSTPPSGGGGGGGTTPM